jgi:hypothetical protein
MLGSFTAARAVGVSANASPASSNDICEMRDGDRITKGAVL